MQIVIEIPDEMYAEMMDENCIETMIIPYKDIIKNGTPLPKGHGRLIDADALWKKWVFDAIGKQEIDDAPTIIEADKTESEG